MDNLSRWTQALQAVNRPEKVAILSSFFKTGKGEYGEGDIFCGINVPDNRAVSKEYYNAPFHEIEQMLISPIHEYRLGALLALVERFHKSNIIEKKEIITFYLAHTIYINNWDLVDLSAPKIVGEYVLNIDDDSLLYTLSESENMWEKRIAIVSTLTLIRKEKYDCTLMLAQAYLSHPHDLIHKATGWMLREIGKRNEPVLIDFLDAHSNEMPRTALRYSIERLTPILRHHYLKK